MPAPTVRVYSDYVCPFCFLQEAPLYQAVDAVKEETGAEVKVEWMPYELRPEPTPTLRPEGEYLTTAWERSVYPLARRVGVEIRLPSVSPQPYSRLAFEGSMFAGQHGKANEYHDAVFRAFFQQDRDIGSPDVLSDIAEAVGLPVEEFSAALQKGAYREEHAQLLRHAVEEIGIRSVPTTFIGERPFVGLSGERDLKAALLEAFGQPAEK